MDEFERGTEQFVLLCESEDDRERDLLLTLLKDADIPAYCRDNGAGSYVRLVTGGSIFGSRIYVPISCQAAAAVIFRGIHCDTPTDYQSDSLEAAYDDYMQTHPQTEDTPPEEGSKGFRMLMFFLIGFGALIVAGLLWISLH